MATSEPPETLPPPIPEPIPGPRATRLRAIYNQAQTHTLRNLSYDNFAVCFPTISAKNESVLRQVQAQTVSKLQDRCTKEFNDICAQRGVVGKLNELESVIGDAVRRRRSDSTTGDTTAPHLLPPDRILSAHLTPALTAHHSQMNARLQTTQSLNAQLYEEIQRQRTEIEQLMSRLEDVVGDVRGANEVLGEVVDVLSLEAREGRRVVASVEESNAQP